MYIEMIAQGLTAYFSAFHSTKKYDYTDTANH